ncbi:hypothetical protein RJ40_11995 [Methanofollis aquaemaris]|uniref:Uncharacterized protein n=1 Tax=Methanofollis aquaemaris TaxID=126734 RepID=A0A8A3S7Z6_9EURY|nr:hypothetical protein [Methanofollis aquaemaris]QSZ68162.1 hypothetical protein RJ40_11995 [Methanofollis aquaemaris]
MYSLLNAFLFAVETGQFQVPGPYLFDLGMPEISLLYLFSALLVLGLFVLVSRLRSPHLQASVFIVLGLSLALLSYGIQKYMQIYFPDLFILGLSDWNWYDLRNRSAALCRFASLLVSTLVPAVYLMPRLELGSRWRCLSLYGVIVTTPIIYANYVLYVTMTPGSGIDLPAWVPAVNPFVSAVAIAAILFGFLVVFREIQKQAPSPTLCVIGLSVLALLALILTFQTAVALCAVLMLIALQKTEVRADTGPVSVALIMGAVLMALVGSWLGSMGPDVGRFAPVWLFPILAMAFATLAPVLFFLPRVSETRRVLSVFLISFAAGLVVGLLGMLTGDAGVLVQPDILPQSAVQIFVNLGLGVVIPALLMTGYLSVRGEPPILPRG